MPRVAQYDVPPEIYATPWLVTLFARNLTMDLVYSMWDFLIVYNHPSLVHCVLLAIVLAHRCGTRDAPLFAVYVASLSPVGLAPVTVECRDGILNAPVAELPGVMSSVGIHSAAALTAIFKHVRALDSHRAAGAVPSTNPVTLSHILTVTPRRGLYAVTFVSCCPGADDARDDAGVVPPRHVCGARVATLSHALSRTTIVTVSCTCVGAERTCASPSCARHPPY
jgi:hypothetical protein